MIINTGGRVYLFSSYRGPYLNFRNIDRALAGVHRIPGRTPPFSDTSDDDDINVVFDQWEPEPELHTALRLEPHPEL